MTGIASVLCPLSQEPHDHQFRGGFQRSSDIVTWNSENTENHETTEVAWIKEMYMQLEKKKKRS